jgi:class 3 adenylate cyclase
MRNPFDDPNIQEILRMQREMDRMGLDSQTLYRLSEQQRLIDSNIPIQDRLMRDLIMRDELAGGAAERLARMSADEAARNSAFFDLTKSANQSMLHLLNDAQQNNAVTAHLASISREWDERVRLLRDVVPNATVELALNSHLSRITEISSLAQASLASLPPERIGEAVRLPDAYRSLLNDKLIDLSYSYRDLIESFETSRASLLSLPPSLSELPSVSYYTSARLTRAISVPEVEAEEGEEEVREEIVAETEGALEARLADLDPKFVSMLNGAQQALDSDNPDRARHFAISMSELYAQVLLRLAPDDEVRDWSGPSTQHDEEGRPTFEARLRYVGRGAGHQPLTEYVIKNFALDLEFLNGFQRGIREVGVDYQPEQLSDLSARMESTLRLIIEVAAADASDTVVPSEVEEDTRMDVEKTSTETSAASPTPSTDQNDSQSSEIAHVLFMDIVGYSKLAMRQQVQFRRQLKEIVRSTREYERAQADDKLISRSTGDGMALVFFGSPEAPVRCAIEIGQALRARPELRLRIGVHSGPVYRDMNVNEELDVVGGGINVAQRVMDCGDARHILVSNTVAGYLREIGDWNEHLHEIGEATVKHGERVHLFNLVTADAGNPEVPEKLRQVGSEASTPQAKTEPTKDAVPAAPKPPIVRAWFDTVINPLLWRLKEEEGYLSKKDWTWSTPPDELKSFYDLRPYYHTPANLEQFLEFYPEFGDAIDRHDEEVGRLFEKCRELQRAIEESPAVAELFKRVTSPESLEETRARMGYEAEGYETDERLLKKLFGAYPESMRLRVFARYMVNRRGDLSSDYTTAPLWNQHKDEFLALLTDPSIRELCEETDRAGEALLETVQNLIGSLKDKRRQLSLESGEPPELPQAY